MGRKRPSECHALRKALQSAEGSQSLGTILLMQHSQYLERYFRSLPVYDMADIMQGSRLASYVMRLADKLHCPKVRRDMGW